jgi:two-component system sensor histidine kinase/response regulator
MKTQPFAPVKFLLVDDLEENLLVLEKLLERPELELLKATSGREALELLLKHEVALALIDVQMPEMDGFELAELMRGAERTRRVPVIFVTAGLREQHRIFEGYDAGAVDFLFKPIDARILRHKTQTFYELYRQRQELERVTNELADTLRFNETFVAAVGHDLRNPLNAVVMATDILERSPAGATIQPLIQRIRSSSRRMTKMIDDLSDLTRARIGGGILIQRAPTDLLAVCRKVVAEHKTAAPDRVIDIDASGDLHGEWDAPRLEQVVSNLVGNSIRHGDATQPIRLRLDGGHATEVWFRIENGGQVPADILPHLFEPFRRGNGRREGLGLGLYIVEQIAIAHGGGITAHSENDLTWFELRLPRRDPNAV